MKGIAVLGCGMVSALGFNAPASLAALRAGVSAVQALPWTDFESGEPLRGAKVSLPQWSEGLEKLADLVAPAIRECLLQADAAPADVPLFIGVAARHRAGRPARLEEDLLDEVQARLGLRPHPQSRLFPLDEAGCAHALLAARAVLDQGPERQLVVAGVDSFLSQPMLDAYLEQRRLITPGNSNGFFPGEAAAAVLVGAPGRRPRDELRILGAGVGLEPAPIGGTQPLRAVGLTTAMRQALDDAGVALKDVAYRLTDLTGEHYRFKEAAFAAGRLNGGEREGPLDLWHPIEYVGAVGAAVLPCLLAQAMHAAREGYAPGPLALCHVGSEEGARAAFVVGLHRGGGMGGNG